MNEIGGVDQAAQQDDKADNVQAKSGHAETGPEKALKWHNAVIAASFRLAASEQMPGFPFGYEIGAVVCGRGEAVGHALNDIDSCGL